MEAADIPRASRKVPQCANRDQYVEFGRAALWQEGPTLPIAGWCEDAVASRTELSARAPVWLAWCTDKRWYLIAHPHAPQGALR